MSKRQNPAPANEILLSGQYTGPERRNRRADDQAWIEVIQQMDVIYADLVRYQVELEKKNADLEDAQRFIHSVISSISDVLVVCNINGVVQQVNPALLDAVGRDENAVIGHPLKHLFAPEHHPMIEDFPSHIRSDSLIDCEVSLLDGEEKRVPLAVNCTARYDHDNRLSGFVITGRPLGELQKAYRDLQEAHDSLKSTQQQLVQSEKMASLGRLVAGVAHELNNPISFVYANMHALGDYVARLRQYLDTVHGGISEHDREALRQQLRIDSIMDDIGPLVSGSLEGAERVSNIVQNLRRFSTPQQQKPQAFNLSALFDQAASWVLRAANIKLERIDEYPEELIIENNEGHVHQILINLVQNAVDAMQHTASPRLTLRVEPGDPVHIHVQDNGPGIPNKDLARIFDPFYTTKPVGSGTGLGLYISYGLASEQCDGSLTAENAPDGGAIFTLTLPARKRA